MPADAPEPVLTELHIELLRAGDFVIDGWCRPAAQQAVGELQRWAYLSCREIGSDEEQYTGYHCVRTPAGDAALARDALAAPA